MTRPDGVVGLDVRRGLWDRVYRIAPLVVVGTREEDGYDLAPKHLAFPLSWENHYGFVCSPEHGTYRNIRRTGEFSVSYPRPSQVVLASLAASPREGWEAGKPVVEGLPTFPATAIDAPLLRDAYFHLECELDRIVEGFGPNVLIAGRVIAAHATEDALRLTDRDAAEQLEAAPLLAYVDPGRYATVATTRAFPFPAGFTR